MLIPHITPEQLRTQPDQTVNIINRLIDQVNILTNKKQADTIKVKQPRRPQGAILFVKFPISRGVLYNRIMDNLLPENEYYSVESRKYVNPQVGLDERNAFINNLRSLQQANNQQISSQTSNLGTSVPSNLGGLMGGTGYWTSRYQTPQTNSLVNDLRTVAQAQALNEMLANEEAMWQKRYKDAYRQYQQRAYKNGNGGGNGGGGNGNGNGNQSGWNGETTLNPTGDDKSKSTTPPNPEDFWVDANTQQQTGAVTPSQIFNVMNPLHWIGLMQEAKFNGRRRFE